MMRELDPRNIAWKRMLEERTCPPIDILCNGGTEVQAHLAGCSACRERLEDSSAVYAVSRTCKNKRQSPPIIPGAVCRIKRDAAPNGIYANHSWHNPPLVLVLPIDTKIDGMLRVAQIHDASELAGPGDFPLTDNYADCFAESWNTWSAFVDTLEYRGMVSQDIAALVAARAHAPRPQIKEDTVEFWFRLQELKIGRFFGKIAKTREAEHPDKLTVLKAWTQKHVANFVNYWGCHFLPVEAVV
ncbi:MAG: hypothetical protein IJU79_05855 [Desulfovibrionaceae bacterium]|nr:hypothetical protein [Desulfovibrionaceae bacterium]